MSLIEDGTRAAPRILIVLLKAFCLTAVQWKTKSSITEAREGSYYPSAMFRKMFVVSPGKHSWEYPSLDMLEDAVDSEPRKCAFINHISILKDLEILLQGNGKPI